MSFAPNTILTRKVPFKAPNDESPDLRPYNEVIVIGQSPVQSNVRAGEWTGQQGDKVSIRPTSFGEVVDRAQGELETDYKVTSEPKKTQNLVHTITHIEPGPSPEEVFRQASPSDEKSDGRKETSFAKT